MKVCTKTAMILMSLISRLFVARSSFNTFLATRTSRSAKTVAFRPSALTSSPLVQLGHQRLHEGVLYLSSSSSSNGPNSYLSRTDVRKMKKADLQCELDSRGLDSSGLRSDLVGRLLNHLTQDSNTKMIPKEPSSDKPNQANISPGKQYILQFMGLADHKSVTASCGLVLYDAENEKMVWKGQTYFHFMESSQAAEWRSLQLALVLIVKHFGVRKLIIQGHGGGTTIPQLQGTYKVNSKRLQSVYDKVKPLLDELHECEVWGIGTNDLNRAKTLAKEALTAKKGIGFEDLKKANDGEEMSNCQVESLDNGQDGSAHDNSSSFADGNHDLVDEEPSSAMSEDVNIVSLPSFSPTKEYVMRFDGGARGNPGTAGSGMVIFDYESGLEVWSAYKYLHETTNNVAEYEGLLSGLEIAIALGARRVIAEGDSNLVVKQVKGEYRVKNENLKVLYEKVKSLTQHLDDFSINYIPRADNFRADQLANVAMDQKMSSGLEILEYEDAQIQSRQPELEQQQEQKYVEPIFDSKGISTSTSSDISPPKLIAPIPDVAPSEHPLSPQMTYTLRFTGGSKGDAGSGASAVLIDDFAKKTLWSGGYFIHDESASQYVASYVGLILGLRKASAMGAKRLVVEGHQELPIKQMKGLWKVKNKSLKPYFDYASCQCRNFEDVDFQMIRGEDNEDAKFLCGNAITNKTSVLNF